MALLELEVCEFMQGSDRLTVAEAIAADKLILGRRSNCCSVDTIFPLSTDLPVVLIRRRSRD
jgi:hypothetical protein